MPSKAKLLDLTRYAPSYGNEFINLENAFFLQSVMFWGGGVNY